MFILWCLATFFDFPDGFSSRVLAAMISTSAPCLLGWRRLLLHFSTFYRPPSFAHLLEGRESSMADALCGPSNALQTFQKHSGVDRTLQQDRLAACQSPAEVCCLRPKDSLDCTANRIAQGFRSSPGPNAGILDAEFQEFQRSQGGLPLESLAPEYHPSENQHGNPINRGFQEPNLGARPDWASDFQTLNPHLTGPPIPQSQFHQHAPLQRTTPSGWHQEFQRTDLSYTFQQDRSAYRPGFQSNSFFQPSLAQQKYQMAQQSPSQTQEPEFDETAFEKAFEQARIDNIQVETEQMGLNQQSSHQEEIQAKEQAKETHESSQDLDHFDFSQFASGPIYKFDPSQFESAEEEDKPKQKETDPPTTDADELARTAGTLLENVRGDTTQKFQDSTFLSLMRQLRDREVKVEGDKIVTVSHPPLSSLQPSSPPSTPIATPNTRANSTTDNPTPPPRRSLLPRHIESRDAGLRTADADRGVDAEGIGCLKHP